MEDWRKVSHLFMAMFLSAFVSRLVMPVMTDVTVEAVCGSGKDGCSLSIYLTGFQQAFMGLGAVLMMPIIGKVSDVYGRKAILQIPLSLAIIPLGILAWKRTTNFFYAHYVFRTLTGIVTESGVLCISLGYLADNVPEEKRASAFGVLSGVVSAAYVSGTLAARFLSTAEIFQVATGISIVAVVYVRVFVEEKSSQPYSAAVAANSLEQPILITPDGTECNQVISSSEKMSFIQQIPSPKDIVCLLKRSTAFMLVACASFFESLADAGVSSFLLYFLKSRFHFQKDQFAVILLIAYGGATVSSIFVLPMLGPFIGEETLLALGLFAGFLDMLLHGIAWSSWVPYAASASSVLFGLVTPCLKCLVSKHTGPNEQGIAQGSIMGIIALANVISPVVYGPISANRFLPDYMVDDFTILFKRHNQEQELWRRRGLICLGS